MTLDLYLHAKSCTKKAPSAPWGMVAERDGEVLPVTAGSVLGGNWEDAFLAGLVAGLLHAEIGETVKVFCVPNTIWERIGKMHATNTELWTTLLTLNEQLDIKWRFRNG